MAAQMRPGPGTLHKIARSRALEKSTCMAGNAAHLRQAVRSCTSPRGSSPAMRATSVHSNISGCSGEVTRGRNAGHQPGRRMKSRIRHAERRENAFVKKTSRVLPEMARTASAQGNVVEVAVGKGFPGFRIGVYFAELFERFRVSGPLFWTIEIQRRRTLDNELRDEAER